MQTRKDATQPATARRRLGRGLQSLISSPVRIDPPTQPSPPLAAHRASGSSDRPAPGIADPDPIRMIATDQIRPNPGQPRQQFDEEALRSLAESIKSAGLIQPIVVRQAPAGGFQLIVGERRWRAAQRIGLSQLPAIVRRIDDQTAAELALIENLQREDLNPIERAEAFWQLTHEHGMTHQELADRVGLNRSSVTNLLRLLELDEFTRDAVRTARLGPGHAKALLAITNIETRTRLADLAIRRHFTVRALERRIAAVTAESAPRPGRADHPHHPHRQAMQRRLSEHLGTKVLIRQGKTKESGRILIEFYTFDQFEGLMQQLGVRVT